MSEEELFIRRLAARLERLGLGEAASAVLEAAGPLTIVAAQLALVVEPLFRGWGTALDDWARLLQDPDQVSALIRFLRREETT